MKPRADSELVSRLATQIQRQRDAESRSSAFDARLGDALKLDGPRPAPRVETIAVNESLAALIRAGVPEDYAEVAASSEVVERPAIQALRRAFERGARFVVISGDIGAGKSTAAAFWLRKMWERHGRCGLLWRHAHEIARASGYGHDAEQLAMETVNYLVLDDLGVEFLDAKGFLSATIDSLVYQRHGNRRPTVVTTNLGLPEFRDRYGARVVDRIKQVGVFIQVAGGSLRQRFGADGVPS